ncbi:MAG: glycosyltransferase [Bacteroidetes bacterium]|nr:glycosyltransferase [Candidatus Colenecus caballi]
MKTVILGTAWPYRGGMADFNERLAHEFQKEGDELQIWTFTLQYPSFLFPGKTQYSPDPEPSDLKIVRKLSSVNPFSWLSTGRQIRKEKPDLLIVPFWMPFMGPCLGTVARKARKSGIRTVAVLHNMIPHEHKPGDRILARYFTRSVDGFTALSESVLADISLFDKVKPRQFCRHPLYDSFGEHATRDESLQFLKLDPNFRYMLFFGLIRDYKGLDLLLRAYADSRFRKMDVRLIVAGEFYGSSDKYFELEKQLGLEGLVIWKSDFVPNGEVRYYFGAADLVVQPYRSATQSGISQIAYHFEKPMLVTNVGGLPEIVPNGKAGLVVNPDPAEIADGMADFFENSRQQQFTEGIISEKAKYSWSNMTAAIRKAAGL